MFRPLPARELPYQPQGPLPNQLRTLYVNAGAEAMFDLLSVNSGPQLKSLRWKSSKFLMDMSPAMVDSMAALSGLVLLELEYWKISRGDLLRILAACSSNLEILSLRVVSGYGSSPFIPDAAMTESPSIEPSALSLLSLPRMDRLRELDLVLDWHQSPAAVHLIQLCPALRSLCLEVDVETSDWSTLLFNLRTFCSRLESIEYKVGYSMQYEYGCYIESSIYAALIRDSTVKGQLTKVVLGVRLDEDITLALLKHSETLEEISLGLDGLGPERIELIGRLLASCRQLGKMDIHDVQRRCKAEDLMELTQKRWVCQDLKCFRLVGYLPNQVKCTGKSEWNESTDKLQIFEEVGQGWRFSRRKLEEAIEDRNVKQRLMVHMTESGLKEVQCLRFNDVVYYPVHRYRQRCRYDDDDDEEEEEEEEEDSEEEEE
ncbi:hypothetical protein FBU30_006740 [Linnemannia zychae]|nr:hypothetical protein FBU30_006740 [Linnemannia zychae]